jgi:O-methyltransferase domain/Dimerisation domain
VTEPSGELKRLVDGYKLTQAIYAAAELGIADRLPREVGELAAETGTHATTLRRLLRALAAAGVLREEGDVFSLTPVGEELREDALRDWILFAGRPLYWNTWTGLMDSVRDGSNAFARMHGDGMWTYRAERPEEQQIFDRAMAALTRRVEAALLEAVDWTRFGTIVDVGGGSGAFLDALCAAHLGIRGVLFDQPQVVGDRPGSVGGNFFEAVPEGGDAYVLKSIVHDWEDEDAARILASIERAGAPTVLIVERDVGVDLESRLSDLNMLVLPGGRERTEAEFAALLEAADFRYVGSTPVIDAVHVFEGVRL